MRGTEANTQYLVDSVAPAGRQTHYSAGEEEDMLQAVRAMLDTLLHLRSISNLQKSKAQPR